MSDILSMIEIYRKRLNSYKNYDDICWVYFSNATDDSNNLMEDVIIEFS